MAHPVFRGDSHPEAAGRAEHLRELACRYARRYGLKDADVEDCAQECICHLLQEFGPDLFPRRPVRDPETWMRRCVIHHVIDYRRHLAAEQRIAAAPTEAAGEESRPLSWDPPAGDPTPEVALERATCWRQVLSALLHLDREAYLCFIRRHFIGESVQQIARSTGRTPNHVSQILLRAARRVRKLLEEQRLTAAEMRRCFDTGLPTALPLPRPSDPEENAESDLANPVRIRRADTSNKVRTQQRASTEHQAVEWTSGGTGRRPARSLLE